MVALSFLSKYAHSPHFVYLKIRKKRKNRERRMERSRKEGEERRGRTVIFLSISFIINKIKNYNADFLLLNSVFNPKI